MTVEQLIATLLAMKERGEIWNDTEVVVTDSDAYSEDIEEILVTKDEWAPGNKVVSLTYRSE